MTDRWLSVEEIAEYLGVSKDTVYAWINKRNMPAHRIGRLWKFKSEEIDEWVRSGGAAENKVERGNEGLGFCWFRLPHAAVETKTGELT
jgi:excisionase family DNA binding protein